MENIQNLFKISYFESLISKQPVTVDLVQFITAIRGTTWEKACTRYQELIVQGDTAAAQQIKQKMPGIIVSGIFEGGHKASHFRSFSGLIGIDIDKYEGDIGELRRKCEKEPFTVATFVSISGNGLKVIVRVDIPDIQQYQAIYLRTMLYYERITGVKADEKCKDLPRIAFAAHDPDAYFNPESTPFVPDKGMADLEHLARREEEKNPIVRGQRNGNLLLLAKQAALYGFSQQEATSFFVKRYSEPDFRGEEIATVTAAGYGYAGQVPIGKMTPGGDKFVPGASMAPKYTTIREEDEDEKAVEQEENDEKQRREAPRIPDKVFDNLPVILQDGIKVTEKDKQQRDMLLLGMLAILSGTLPNVKIGYMRKRCSPHLYFFGVANPGTGKGIVDLAHLLALPIHEHYEREGAKLMKIYNEKLFDWERELRLFIQIRQETGSE